MQVFESAKRELRFYIFQPDGEDINAPNYLQEIIARDLAELSEAAGAELSDCDVSGLAERATTTKDETCTVVLKSTDVDDYLALRLKERLSQALAIDDKSSSAKKKI